jgi:hypothetical protein
MLTDVQLDTLLTLQLATAWAGERSGDEPRLGWWATDMVSEFGGHALFARLTPRTAQWAALEVAREAARRTDAAARAKDANPDRLRSLFSLGFAVDEQLADRLALPQALRRAARGQPPRARGAAGPVGPRRLRGLGQARARLQHGQRAQRSALDLGDARGPRRGRPAPGPRAGAVHRQLPVPARPQCLSAPPRSPSRTRSCCGSRWRSTTRGPTGSARRALPP